MSKGEKKAGSSETLLTPGQRVRPPTGLAIAASMMDKLYGMPAIKVSGLNSYDDRNYHVLCGEEHANPHVRTLEKDGYVLKVVNSLDSRKTEVIEAQTEMLLFLNARGFRCPQPVKNLNGAYYSLESYGDDEKYAVRLLVYRTGELLHRVPLNGELLQKVGRFAADLDKALLDFHHAGYKNHRTMWMLSAVPNLREFSYAVKNASDRKLAHDVIEAFEGQVLAAIGDLETGIIHGDLNEQNIVMSADCTDIAAVIDFGDAHEACLVFELAIVLCYMLLQTGDIGTGKHVIDGYESVRKLTLLEKRVLKVSVCARMCQSLVMGAYSHMYDPENEYLLITQKSGWTLLKKLWPTGQRDVDEAWGLI